MRVNGRSSSFQSVILDIVRKELNMMLSETFQLKRSVNFSDNKKLTKMVLKQISNCQIVSAHLSPEKAKKYIELLDKLECHKEIGGGLKKKSNYSKIDNDFSNPYSDSPFS